MTNAFGREAVVAPGTGDNMAAALALGLQPGDVAISLGTSGTVFAVSDTPTADPSGAVAGFADATGRFLPLVCTLNATKVTDTDRAPARRRRRRPRRARARSRPPGAGGATLVPYFDGERTPNRPDAIGRVHGSPHDDRSRRHRARRDRRRRVRAARRARRARRLRACRRTGDVVLVGGGARSRAFRQVVADLSGRAVVVPEATEHVAAGACVQAAAVLHGRAPDVVARDWNLAVGPTIEPDRNVDHGAIRAAYARRAADDRGRARGPGPRSTVGPCPPTSAWRPARWTTPSRSSTSSATRRSCGLKRISEAEALRCTLLAKVETVNPGGSVKDRVAIAMIDAAERDGLLKPGGTIVEPTSGNTGAGLAIVAAQRGYRCIFVMSDKMSDEKVALLRSYGAEVVVCPTAVPPEDPRSYYSTAERLVRETPGAFRPDQYSNAANPLAHEQTTGPEIWRADRRAASRTSSPASAPAARSPASAAP